MLISITNTCKCYSPGGTSSVEVSAVTEKNIGHVDQFDIIMLASSANNPSPPPSPHTHDHSWMGQNQLRPFVLSRGGE